MLSGYDSLSQRYWADYVQKTCTSFSWSVLALPPRYFSWRMRGSPLSFSAMNADVLNGQYDIIVATSTVDLSVVQSLYPALRTVPSVLYFHENQFAYPTENAPKNAIDWQMVNLYSALRANTLVFNSDYNKRSFLNGVDTLLRKLPDLVPKDLIENLLEKSSVISVPVPEAKQRAHPALTNQTISIIWNHRWEWDKNPDLLVAIINQLKSSDISFSFTITGQQFKQKPDAFIKLKQEHSDVIKHMGYVENRVDYQILLGQADIALSTAIHEFQGIAVMEAVQSGCIPLLPNDLSYPDFFNPDFLYSVDGDINQQASAAVSKLLRIIKKPPIPPDLSEYTEPRLAKTYANMLLKTLR